MKGSDLLTIRIFGTVTCVGIDKKILYRAPSSTWAISAFCGWETRTWIVGGEMASAYFKRRSLQKPTVPSPRKNVLLSWAWRELGQPYFKLYVKEAELHIYRMMQRTLSFLEWTVGFQRRSSRWLFLTLHRRIQHENSFFLVPLDRCIVPCKSEGAAVSLGLKKEGNTMQKTESKTDEFSKEFEKLPVVGDFK